jgi:predicted RNase H-like HicB family nuclease
MGSEIIFVVEEAAEGGFFARALGESIFTEGETLIELKQNIREAVLLHFEEGQTPRIIRLHFVKEELMTV